MSKMTIEICCNEMFDSIIQGQVTRTPNFPNNKIEYRLYYQSIVGFNCTSRIGKPIYTCPFCGNKL